MPLVCIDAIQGFACELIYLSYLIRFCFFRHDLLCCCWLRCWWLLFVCGVAALAVSPGAKWIDELPLRAAQLDCPYSSADLYVGDCAQSFLRLCKLSLILSFDGGNGSRCPYLGWERWAVIPRVSFYLRLYFLRSPFAVPGVVQTSRSTLSATARVRGPDFTLKSFTKVTGQRKGSCFRYKSMRRPICRWTSDTPPIALDEASRSFEPVNTPQSGKHVCPFSKAPSHLFPSLPNASLQITLLPLGLLFLACFFYLMVQKHSLLIIFSLESREQNHNWREEMSVPPGPPLLNHFF